MKNRWARDYWRYTLKYELNRRWEQRWVWWVLKLIPRGVKKWIVVQSAVIASGDSAYSGSVGYKEMHDVWVKR